MASIALQQKKDEEKGEIVGTALMITDRWDEEGSASKEIQGYQL